MAFFQFIGTAGASAFKGGIESIRLEFVEMMGMGYVIEHCISHFLETKQEESYRTYVTEALRILTENTAKSPGGSYLSKSFSDIYKKAENEEPEKTEEEIISEIDEMLAKARGEGGEIDEPV